MSQERVISRLQEAIEAVESLAPEDQELLIEIISERLVQLRRAELVKEVAEARRAYRAGEVRRGTVADLLKDLRGGKPLVWAAAFVCAYKRAASRQPALRGRIRRVLQQLAEDPFHPSLHSHKLKGELAGVWACTVDRDNRILFELVRNPETGKRRYCY